MAEPRESNGGEREPDVRGDLDPHDQITFDEWVSLGQPEHRHFFHADGRGVQFYPEAFDGNWDNLTEATKIWWTLETPRTQKEARARAYELAKDPTHRHHQYAAEVIAMLVAARIAK